MFDLCIYNMHYTRMHIKSDPCKSAANLKKHGVSFEEAATALLDTLARTLEEGSENIRLISARQATRNERMDYET